MKIDIILDHIGIPVKNVEETIPLYQALGFNIRDMITIPGTDRHVCILEQCRTVLELYESADPNNYGKIDHFALSTDNLQQLYDDMRKNDAKILYGGLGSIEFTNYKIVFFTIEMPGGEKIEFCQKYHKK